MPIIKSAKKKLKQDKKRTNANSLYKKKYRDAIKKANRMTGDKEVQKKAFSVIDKAAKKGILHKNKAARLKSQISRKKRQ